MRPFLEKPHLAPGTSWTLLDRRLEGGIPFQWHHHREYELTLTLNSAGQRFVGDHVGAYRSGDLVLLGPNLAHTWASSDRPDPSRPHAALVMWFRPEWIEALVGTAPELGGLAPMLAAAARGLRFSDDAAAAVRPAIEAMVAASPARRLLALVGVLDALSSDGEAMPLASPGSASARARPAGPDPDRPRIERVLDHLHLAYQQPVSVETLAGLACLSASGLHRLFRRHTGTTPLGYVARLRVGRACRMLVASDRPVSHIAEEAGYDNLSHFNRQFRALRGETPRQFRARHAVRHGARHTARRSRPGETRDPA